MIGGAQCSVVVHTLMSCRRLAMNDIPTRRRVEFGASHSSAPCANATFAARLRSHRLDWQRVEGFKLEEELG